MGKGLKGKANCPSRSFCITVWGVFFVASVLFAGSAWAVPIKFVLGNGGDVSYAGGNTPLITTNGVVNTVGNGSTTIDLSGPPNATLDFETGAYTSGSDLPGGGFVNTFGAGGSVTVTSGSGGNLLTGTFASDPTFTYNAGAGFGGGTLVGDLLVSFVESSLAASLGFTPPPPAADGSITQVEVFFGSLPAGFGQAFQGQQLGGDLTVNDAASVPEPGVIILLGSGLIGFAAWRRKQERQAGA